MNIAYFYSFNNSFNCVVKNIHSKHSFIKQKLQIIHSKNLFIQSNPKLFIQRKYSFQWKMDYRPGLRMAVWVGLKGRNKPRCSTIGMAGRPIIERLLRALWTADIFLIIILSHLNGKRYAAKITSSTICKWINSCSVEKDWHFEPRVQQLFSLK